MYTSDNKCRNRGRSWEKAGYQLQLNKRRILI